MGFCFLNKFGWEDPLKIMARHEFVSSMPLPNLERSRHRLGLTKPILNQNLRQENKYPAPCYKK